jgi:sec-independent protein translocase protein TatA
VTSTTAATPVTVGDDYLWLPATPCRARVVKRLSFDVVIGDILQPTHLLFVLVVALLVLGPKRLPEVGRSLGKGLRDFKTALSGEESIPVPDEVPRQTSTDTAPPAAERAEHIS